ncbi:MAG: glycosyltransferase family 4 protein [Desulfobacterales bacterium]|nr:glycosyltransferase family 4 protein [Desulfobacterales bacterium]
MKVLLIHNYYKWSGGEDHVFLSEKALLENHGHEVLIYTKNNNELEKMNPLILGSKTIWNHDVYRELSEFVKKTKPNVVHFHNTFPIISPSAYYAIKKKNIPIIQTLHNFRLFCLNSNLLYQQNICEQCMGKLFPWKGVLRSCYRSILPSLTLSAMNITHQILNTWKKKVDIFIALTDFSRQKFIEGGLPDNKILIKPNFFKSELQIKKRIGEYALFVGRLTDEKGINIIISAWENLKIKIPLKIIGDGPLYSKIKKQNKEIEFLGQISRDHVISFMAKAKFLILPSICYENFPMTIPEAYSNSLPIIASNLGVMSSLIINNKTGLHFKAGDSKDLASKVEWAWLNPCEMIRMGENALKEYKTKYSEEINYKMLMNIYHEAI